MNTEVATHTYNMQPTVARCASVWHIQHGSYPGRRHAHQQTTRTVGGPSMQMQSFLHYRCTDRIAVISNPGSTLWDLDLTTRDNATTVLRNPAADVRGICE